VSGVACGCRGRNIVPAPIQQGENFMGSSGVDHVSIRQYGGSFNGSCSCGHIRNAAHCVVSPPRADSSRFVPWWYSNRSADSMQSALYWAITLTPVQFRHKLGLKSAGIGQRTYEKNESQTPGQSCGYFSD
jgi:hypothetical protein